MGLIEVPGGRALYIKAVKLPQSGGFQDLAQCKAPGAVYHPGNHSCPFDLAHKMLLCKQIELAVPTRKV